MFVPRIAHVLYQLILWSSLVPSPSVTIRSLSNQKVGDPLLLECNVTTVRGITSSVDIVWITNDKEVRRVSNMSRETVDSHVVYSDTYNSNGSLLSEDDHGTVYHCSVEINSIPLVHTTSTFVGESVHVITIIYYTVYNSFVYSVIPIWEQ